MNTPNKSSKVVGILLGKILYSTSLCLLAIYVIGHFIEFEFTFDNYLLAYGVLILYRSAIAEVKKPHVTLESLINE